MKKSLAALPLFAALAGCTADREPERSSTPPALATGTLAGIVKLASDSIPAPTEIQNTTDPEVCGRRQSLEDLVVSSRNGGIQNVILALTDVPADRIPLLHSEELVIDNRDCRFSPHAAVLTVGSTVAALNSDPILHTTHFYGAFEANLSLPVEGVQLSRTVDKPGMIVVKCDVHGWMQAFIRVDTHPFHAVSEEDGSFLIQEIPVGDYTLESWHEKLGTQKHRIQIEAGKKESIQIEYRTEGRHS